MIVRNFFIIILIFFVLPALAVANILQIETAKPLPELKLPKIDIKVLDSGIRFFSVKDTTYPVFRARLLMRAGLIQDSLDKKGLANVTARLAVLGGSGRYSPEKFEDAVEDMAISISSSSNREETEFIITALSDDFEKAFNIFLDVVFSPKFNKKRFGILRERMKAEIARDEDDPENVASRKIRNLVFGENNPWGWTVDEKSVSNINRKDVLEFYKRYYHPQNMWIGISGNFDENLALKILNSKTKKFNKTVFKKPADVPNVAKNKPEKILEIKPTTYAYLRMGMRGVNRFSPDKYMAIVGNEILGGSAFNNMLMQEVRTKKGLVYSIGSRLLFDSSDGMFLAYASTKMGKVDDVIKSIKGNVGNLKNNKAIGNKLFLAKRSMLGSQLFTLSQPFSVVSSAVSNDFYGYPENYWFIWRDGIRLVTSEQIKSFFEKNLKPENFDIVIVKGEEK